MAGLDTRVCNLCGQLFPITHFRKNGKSLGGYTRGCKPCLLAKDRARWAAMTPQERDETEARYRSGQAEYRRKNVEKVRASKAAHYQRTKEYRKAKGYEWRRKNPQRLRELAKGWYVKRYRNIRGGVTAARQADWAMAQKKVCHWCGKRCAKDYHIDHIMPLSRGGKHELTNLAIACPDCNLRKNARDPIEWAQIIGKLL